MSAQMIPKKLRKQSISNMIKPSEKNVGPEPAGCILSDQLKTEIKSFVAKEFGAMKEEYELKFDEIHEKLKEKESEVQELKFWVDSQRITFGAALTNTMNRLEFVEEWQEAYSVDGASLAQEKDQQLKEVMTMKDK